MNIMFTLGIVFVEINALALPLSITGIVLSKAGDDYTVVVGSRSYTPSDGSAVGDTRTKECSSFDTTPRDSHDMLGLFHKTFMEGLENALPGWLRFAYEGKHLVDINSIQAELTKGIDVQHSVCRGAPLIDGHMYTVLKVKNNFTMSLYGQEVKMPAQSGNKQFCFIIDLCQDYGTSVFIMFPDGSRDILDNFNMFKSLREQNGIQIRPRGIGVSMMKHIDVLSKTTSMQLWNGDQVQTYQ